MASVQERRTQAGDKRWAVLYRDDGKQRSRTFPTRKGADHFRRLVDLLGPVAALHQLALPDTSNVPTVSTYVDGYVNAKSGITEGTRSDYRSYATRDLGDLGALPVDQVTREAVERWVNGLAQRLSGKSIRNRHALLSAAMSRAVSDGLIPENPSHGIRLPRTIKREMTFLTHGEFARLLDHVPAYWHPLVVTLAGTGMRWGEATALAVRDADLDDNVPSLRVRQAWKHTDGHTPELGPPKTRKGARTISLPPQVVTTIRPLLQGRKPDEFVFTNHQGRRVHQSTFLVHVWQPAIKAAKLGKTPRVHDLRHSHAAWLIAAGVPLPVIQARLGHESIQTTVDVYGHLATDSHQLAARAASAALGSSLPAIEG